jgi:collagen type VII alpha
MTTAIAAMTITGALSLSAQTPTTPPTSSDQRTGASQSSDQTVTVTGCIQQDTSSSMGRSSGATGTTGAAGTTGSSGSTGSTASGTTGASGTAGASGSRGTDYVLTNVKMAQGSSTSGLGTATRVSLSGQDAELQKHLNHQVEVSGRLSAASASMSGSTSGTTSGTTGSTASGTTGSTSGTTAGSTGSRTGSGSSMSDLPKLQVSSIKMVSATCPSN